MRALVLALVLAFVAAAAAGAIAVGGGESRQATRPPLHVGIVANTLDASERDRDRMQDLVRETGAGWIREEFRWGEVEPVPGARRWWRLDRMMEQATRNGLRVLPLLIGTPTWAGRGGLALPDDPASFGRFGAMVAERYGPRGRFWRDRPGLDATMAPRWFEVWNEPYYEHFSQTGVDPARYARMMVATAAAGRAANPRTRWLMAVDLVFQTSDGASYSWLDAMYADQPALNASFDGVAVHPYSFYGLTTSSSRVAQEFRFDRLDAIHAQLVARGAGDKPMWITELGWSTCDLRPDCVNEKAQSQRIRDLFGLLRGRYADLVDAVFLYRLQDLGEDRGDREQLYGLLRRDGSPKPAWRAFAAEAR